MKSAIGLTTIIVILSLGGWRGGDDGPFAFGKGSMKQKSRKGRRLCDYGIMPDSAAAPAEQARSCPDKEKSVVHRLLGVRACDC